jgi:hypothetical protein
LVPLFWSDPHNYLALYIKLPPFAVERKACPNRSLSPTKSKSFYFWSGTACKDGENRHYFRIRIQT